MLAAKLASPLKCPALLLKRSKTSSLKSHSQSGTTDGASSEQQAAAQDQGSQGQSGSEEKQTQAKPAVPTVQLHQHLSVATLEKTLQENSCFSAVFPDEKQGSRTLCSRSGPDGSTLHTNREKPRKGSIYDPPEGAAKRPGTYRNFPKKGDAVYWCETSTPPPSVHATCCAVSSVLQNNRC